MVAVNIIIIAILPCIITQAFAISGKTTCLARNLALDRSLTDCGVNLAVTGHTEKGNIKEWNLGREMLLFQYIVSQSRVYTK